MIDEYYNRVEVSNSDLSALKEYLEGKEIKDRSHNYLFGNVFDAMLTEPKRIDYRSRAFDGKQIPPDIYHRSTKMKLSFLTDPYCSNIQKLSDTQTIHTKNVVLDWVGFEFDLDMRCKLDFDIKQLSMAVDLKSTFAISEKQFRSAIDMFDYDRQAAVYMTICNYDKFGIIGVSKINYQIFKITITKDSELYNSGMIKFKELAAKWYMFFNN